MDEIANGEGSGALRGSSTDPEPPDCDICSQQLYVFDRGAQFRCRKCAEEHTIHITSHAWDRWNERSLTPDTHPIQAYKDGIRFLDEGTRVKGDEFRYHHPSRCLFIRRGVKVVTVEHVPTCRTPIQRAAVRSLIRSSRETTSQIAELCRECDITVDELKGIVRFERGITNAGALHTADEELSEAVDPADALGADGDGAVEQPE